MMQGKPRGRLLGLLLVAASALALTACNSDSGNSPKASGAGNTVTGTESTTPARAPSAGSLAGALNGQVKNAP